MHRRKFVATGGLLLCSGCLSDPYRESQEKSEFVVTNRSSNKIDLSLRLTNERGAFAVEGLVLESGDTGQFEQAVPESLKTMNIVAKILDPVEKVYKHRIRASVPEYIIQIQSDNMEVIWDEG
jgi:hypothetical protein